MQAVDLVDAIPVVGRRPLALKLLLALLHRRRQEDDVLLPRARPLPIEEARAVLRELAAHREGLAALERAAQALPLLAVQRLAQAVPPILHALLPDALILRVLELNGHLWWSAQAETR